MPRPLCDSPFIYGLHDSGGEQTMLDVGTPGWVLVTEAIGHDPNDRSGADYRRFSDRDLGVIVRLNNAYNPGGTISFERDYADFAGRCANFVAASHGAHIWILGNETNHPIEWPGAEWNWGPGWPAPVSPDKRGEEITPARYASCYKQCRTAIRAVAGHGQDQVLVSAPAPWNILLTYPANPNGDWVKYFTDILTAIGAGNLDGITLHTYTHGGAPALITSDERMGDARFKHLRYHFRAYQDFMAAIPQAMRGLPVYITESNQGDQAWDNANTGWVRAAYAEIDAWNRANAQKIRSLLLYRWPQVPNDRWGIEGKAGVIDDFRQAFGPRYQWTATEAPWAALTRRVTELEQATAAQKTTLDALKKVAGDAAALTKEAEGYSAQAIAARPADLRSQFETLSAQIKDLEGLLGHQPAPSGLQIVDRIGHLPAGTGTPYPRRDPAVIRRIVIHHTVTPGDISPERVAQAMVARGLPGITYHYLIAADGTIFETQALDVVTGQTNAVTVNGVAVGVALAGDFTTAVPTDTQMTSAARLVAQLLERYGLTTEAVIGRREVDTTASPGDQWLGGAQYKTSLLAKVALLLKPKDESAPEQLQKRIAELEIQVAALNAQIATLNGQAPGLTAEVAEVAALQTHISELDQTLASQTAEVERLRALLADNTTGRVARPAIVDMVDKLPQHPTLPPYGARTRPISMIVIHHTDTPKTMMVQKIAEYHVYGERKDASGNIVKAQWPGVGYHFMVGPDGVIYQGQRETTRSYHVGGDPNDYSVAISLIGRFMRKNYDGTDRAPEDQVPTPQQLRSAGQLAAWLMQEYQIPIEQIKGHRDVWPQATVCPGEHWKTGLTWHPQLLEEVKSAQTAAGTGGIGQRKELYLLFWDHGDAWAEADWRSAQGYIARFRPTAGFALSDAFLAEHVVIVGGTAGVSGQDEARLSAAGIDVYRLEGKDEEDTKRMLDELAAKGTPWPGAPAQPASMAPKEILEVYEGLDEVIFPDEWTMPEDWQTPDDKGRREKEEGGPSTSHSASLREQMWGPGQMPGGDGAPPKVFVPEPSAERGEVRE